LRWKPRQNRSLRPHFLLQAVLNQKHGNITLHKLYALKILTPILVIAVIVIGVVVSIFGLWPSLEGQQQQTALGFHRNSDSGITDAVGDVRPLLQRNRSSIVPEVQDYHDIVSASVKTLEGPSFLLTTILAGNPNLNEKYQTTYAWHIVTKSNANDQEQLYTVAFSNFPSGFTNRTESGWYYAIFNNTDGSLVLPFTKTWDMPEDRVEFPVEDFYIGSPSEFRYWVASYVRVSNTNFGGIPDYLMDDAPPITGPRLRGPFIPS
jgi:hypothetical protein